MTTLSGEITIIDVADGKNYVLNILGGTRSIVYDKDGKNPLPVATDFDYELLEDGLAVTPKSVSWTTSGRMTGNGTGKLFKPVYTTDVNGGTGGSAVLLDVVYKGLILKAVAPISISQIGATGSTGDKGDKGDKGERGNDGPQGIRGPDGPPGEDGQPGPATYTWIKYADTSTGGGINDYPDGKKYIGLAHNKDTDEESTDPSKYTWSLIKGDKGERGPDGPPGIEGQPGPDGKPRYTWIRYADDKNGTEISPYPEGKRYLGIAHNKESSTALNTPSLYDWSPLYDNVKVGGRNLLNDSHFRNEELSPHDFTAVSGAHQTIEEQSIKIINSSTASTRIEKVIQVEDLTQYTYTMNAHLTQKPEFRSFVGAAQVAAHENEYKNGFKSYSVTFIATQEEVTVRAYLPNAAVGAEQVIEWEKLEKGNVATDWTPSNEDIANDIDRKTDQADFDRVSADVGDLTENMEAKADLVDFTQLEKEYEAKVAQDALDKQATVESLVDLEDRTVGVEAFLDDKKIKWNFIETAISGSEEGIFIGNEGTEMGVLVSANRISFMDKGTEVAYISNKTMEITHGIFVESAVIGRHKINTLPDGKVTVFTYIK